MRMADTVSPLIRMDEPILLELQEFFVSIEEGRPPETDGYAGLRVVKILEAASRSIKDGVFIDIDEKEDARTD